VIQKDSHTERLAQEKGNDLMESKKKHRALKIFVTINGVGWAWQQDI
jgi:hypothetical protein